MIRLLLLIFFCSLTFAHAQTMPLVTVVDKTSGEPIEGVFLYRADRSAYTSSDAKGRANLADIGTEQAIHFQHAAYLRRRLTLREIHQLGYVVKLEERTFRGDEVVITTPRRHRDFERQPQSVAHAAPKDIDFKNPQTAADLLTHTGEVFVQKSQLGGGSPMIRGFSANRVLIVLDGVRMNNAIYRSGNLQNVISLDANSMERSEVLFGPGSVMYGSDALGGVMLFTTRQARLSGDGVIAGGNAFARYSSASTEQTGHFDYSIGLRRWAFLTSVTYSDFDDLRAGAQRGNYPEFGIRDSYVERRAGSDVIVENDNKNLQRESGYHRLNLLQKIRFIPRTHWETTYTLQYSTTGDIPRYDRLIQEHDGDPRYAEWYYGPQRWLMNTVTVSKVMGLKFVDELDLTAAHQIVKESRHDRDFQNEDLRHREENAQVFSLNADFDKRLYDEHLLYYGLEATYNSVESSAEIEDIDTGIISPTSTRYPDGGSSTTSLAAYVGGEWTPDPAWIITAGGRYSRNLLHSEFDDTTFFSFPFDEIDLNNGAFTASLGAVFQPAREWRLHANFASGFRAPNVDDAAKVFDSEPGSVVVPNPDLGSEFVYSGELGIKKSFGERVTISSAGYYSRMVDAMVRRDFTFNGQDSILYDGTVSRVQAVVNAGKAYVAGFDFNLTAKLDDFWTLSATTTYTAGRDLADDVPLRHVPPLFGQASLLHERDAWTAELFTQFNAWKRFEDLSPSEQDKPHLYTEDGTPQWFTINLRGAYRIGKHTEITAALENILDRHYRPFASGISAPGRNLIVAVRQGF